MTRERLEDLGRIADRLYHILREDSVLDECNSKHSVDTFIQKYSSPEKLEELHEWLRWHKEKLDDLESIAFGNDNMNWTISSKE